MNLVKSTDKRLRAMSVPIVFDGAGAWSKEKLGSTIMLMLDLMYMKDGIGLAAPQVGINYRLVVVDPEGDRHNATVLINPEIWFRSEATEIGPEGCLSLPDQWGMVERAKEIKVRYMNRDGLACELAAESLMARVIQHEVDHLDGILFIDKIQP